MTIRFGELGRFSRQFSTNVGLTKTLIELIPLLQVPLAKDSAERGA